MSPLDQPPEKLLNDFENLLQRAKELTLHKVNSLDPTSISPTQFELLTFEVFQEVAKNTPFQKGLIHTKDRDFPDIVTGAFGVEVKATKDDKWTSIGNSVLESSRAPGIQKIYTFFGKLGGAPDIRYKNYEDSLGGISVTHYPRYQINMNLEEEESIFTKMGITYQDLRKLDNPVKPIRSYYKTKLEPGQSLWWIDDDIDKTATTDPVIKSLSSLSSDQKDRIKADIFVYFPEILSSSTRKYERVPAYLASAHSVLTSNLRDFFTSGGQVERQYEDGLIRVPQIVNEACRLQPLIVENLHDKSQNDLSEAWGKDIENFTKPVIAWLAEADRYSNELNLPMAFSKIFNNTT